MDSSAVIVSATTFCDVERKPFALALYRQSERKLDNSIQCNRAGAFRGVRAGNGFEARAMRSRSEVSAEFVELGVMGQWRHRREDRREAGSSMQRQSRCKGGG